MQSGKYAEACPKLESSQRLDPGPGTQFHLADCYEHVGRTASAWALFLEVASAAKAAGKHDEEQISRDRAAKLQPKLSKLTVVLPAEAQVEGLKVTRGQSEVDAGLYGSPVAVDPGKYVITVTAPGKKTQKIDIEVLGNGDSKTVNIRPLEDDAGGGATAGAGEPETSSSSTSVSSEDVAKKGTWQRPAAYAALGVGVVGIGVGTFFALKSSSKRKDADDLAAKCGDPCLASNPITKDIDDADSQARSAKTNATIAFVVGGVGIAGGVTLFVLSTGSQKKESSAVHVTPVIGIGSLGLEGAF